MRVDPPKREPAPAAVTERLGDRARERAASEIDHWKRYLAQTCTAPINWKVVLDNFNESYHLPTVHPQAAGKTEEPLDRDHLSVKFGPLWAARDGGVISWRTRRSSMNQNGRAVMPSRARRSRVRAAARPGG